MLTRTLFDEVGVIRGDDARRQRACHPMRHEAGPRRHGDAPQDSSRSPYVSGWCRDAREGDRRRNSVVQTDWLMPHEESATPQPRRGQHRRAYQGPGLFRPHHLSCVEPLGSQCAQACCCPTHIALRRPSARAWRPGASSP